MDMDTRSGSYDSTKDADARQAAEDVSYEETETADASYDDDYEEEDDYEDPLTKERTPEEEQKHQELHAKREQRRAEQDEEQRRQNAKKKAKKKKKKWVKWVVIGGVLAALVGSGVYNSKKAAEALYHEDVAGRRDITTYHNFTGTIASVDSKNIMSAVSGVKVLQVNVEEGDMVKEGDVIAVLNTEQIDEQIAEKEASMSTQSANNALTIENAQQSYNNLQKNIEDGLDASLQSAQSGIDSAFASLNSAQEAFNNEVALNNQQLSSTILSAIQQVQSAYESAQRAALSAQQARDTKKHAQDQAEDQGFDLDDFTYNQSIDSADLSEEQAWAAYNRAQTSYQAAKINEENQLTKLFDSVIQAQNSYLSAIDSYNATVRGNEQKLQAYQLQIRQAKASANDSVSQLQLQNLKDNLDDYVLTAPIDGQITKLNVKEGDITSVSATTSLATVTNYDRMKINIQIGEYDIVDLEEGDSVSIHVSAIDKDYDGVITKIDREATVENGVSYFNAEVNFDPDKDVRGGMSAEVKLTINDEKQTLAVLSDAIQTADDGSAYVYIENPDKPKEKIQKPVTLGITDGTYTQITDGIEEGDKVYYIENLQDFTRQMMMGGGMYQDEEE